MLSNFFFLLSFVLNVGAVLYEGDPCTIQGERGICTNQDQCPQLRQAYMQGQIRNEEIPRCGYTMHKEVICCPTSNLYGSAATAYCRELDRSSKELEFHVVNGLPVIPNEYKFMASIGYKGPNDLIQFFCGGALISERFVLTAAHCVNDPKKRPSVVMLGQLKLSEAIEEVLVEAKKVHIHKDFLPSSTYNDIALIELETSVEFAENIRPLCLYTKTSEPPADWKVFVAGWGRTENATQSNSLMKAELSVLSLSSCRDKLVDMPPTRRLHLGIQSTQICAVGNGKDACDGDSGGPLIYEGSDNVLYAGGITAAGMDCGGIAPALYTRIASYLNFIENIVWQQKNLKKNVINFQVLPTIGRIR